MGNVWQRLLSNYHNKEVRILMCGLDAAGKTTTLYKLKLGEVVTTIPTIGFNVESVDYKNISFVSWDIGGRDKIRPLWRHYYQNTQAVIFVIDSNDRERIPECKDELWRMLEEEELNNAIILVMANKQDLPNAMSVEEVSQKLEIERMRDKTIYVQGTSATSGDGLYEGLSWIQTAMTHRARKKSTLKPIKEVLTAPEGKKSHSWLSVITDYFMHISA